MSHLRAAALEGGYVVKRTPGRVHGTFDSAAAEAVRLTAENDGPAFLVLKVVGAVIAEAVAGAAIANPAVGPLESQGTDPDAGRWPILEKGERYGDSHIDPDVATGCADDQAFAGVPIETVRQAAEDLRS